MRPNGFGGFYEVTGDSVPDMFPEQYTRDEFDAMRYNLELRRTAALERIAESLESIRSAQWMR